MMIGSKSWNFKVKAKNHEFNFFFFFFFASPGNLWNFPIRDQPETPAVEIQWLKLSFNS